MSNNAPPWLAVMRGITGLTETPGDADNPKIIQMAEKIAETYPEMKEYCDQYTHDSIAWCGLCAAYCMTMAGIRPPFGETDTDKFLWALSWEADPQYQLLDNPVVGCVVVMTRSGGGHVTFFESEDGSNYKCRGGNQGDMVNVSSYAKDTVVGLMWPRAGGEMPRRELSEGDEGEDVAEVQAALGLPDDGDFGPLTKAGVQGYQSAVGLDADGVVGAATWEALDELDRRVQAGGDLLPAETEDEIIAIAERSPIAQYSWSGRGIAPIGYITGMALTFALAVQAYGAGDPAALEMGKAASGDDPDHDALDWYADQFDDAEMDNSKDGLVTLRHLFVLLLGLGPRESSGNHWCGRDQSASNTDSDTCEAGLFQTSWNIRSCSDTLPPLLAAFWEDPNGFLEQFNREAANPPSNADLKNYGDGDGVRYQWLAKYSPAFAAFVTAVGLRNLRQHWGPINRHEAALVEEADELFKQVQQVLDEGGVDPGPGPDPGPDPRPPRPGFKPTVTVAVDPPGSARVVVTGSAK